MEKSLYDIFMDGEKTEGYRLPGIPYTRKPPLDPFRAVVRDTVCAYPPSYEATKNLQLFVDVPTRSDPEFEYDLPSEPSPYSESLPRFKNRLLDDPTDFDHERIDRLTQKILESDLYFARDSREQLLDLTLHGYVPADYPFAIVYFSEPVSVDITPTAPHSGAKAT